MQRNRLGFLAATALAVAAAAAIAPASAQAGTARSAAGSCPGAHVLTGQQALASPLGSSSLFIRAKAQHVQWLSSLSCVSTGRSHGFQPSSSSAARQTINTINSGNWSGYQVNQPARFVQSGWNVPTVVSPSPGYSSIGYYSSTWAGIGGGFNGGSGALIQGGTTQDVSASGVASYYAWYEIVNGTGDTHGEQKISNLPIHPGDASGSAALWNSSTGQAEIGVCNFNYGPSGTCINTFLNSSAPSATAEWIEEAPSSSSGILPLANFGSVNFYSGCWSVVVPAPGGPCNSIQLGSPTEIDLRATVFGKAQTLASPGAITGASVFADTYHQPH